jgi:hypothetical protein
VSVSSSAHLEVRTVRISTKDVVAILLIALIVVPYIGYLIAGDMRFINDPLAAHADRRVPVHQV